MRSLRASLIRLAHSNPDLRPRLLPLLSVRTAGFAPLEVWEKERPTVRAAITPAFFLKVKRVLRSAPPAALNLFHLYNWIQKSSLGAPVPEEGFLPGVKEGIVALSRTLPRLMDRLMADEVADALKSSYARVVMPLKKIDGGRGNKRNFLDVSDALANGLALVLSSAGLPSETFNLPGTRFLGVRPTQAEESLPAVPESVAKIFTPEEESLPTKARQGTKDIDKLYEDVGQAEEFQLDLLNRGTGLDSKIGARVVYPGEKVDLMAEPGPVIMIGPRKKRERVIQKTRQEGEDVDSALDLVRSTIAVDGLEDIPRVMGVLRGLGVEFARKPKNRFGKPTEVGYRDLMFNVRYPNGHVGEIQVNVKSMLEAKNLGHSLYEKVRDIESKKKEQGDRSLTLEEQETVDIANESQKRLYDEAWNQAMTSGVGLPKFATEKTAGNVKHFEYKDRPVRVVRGMLPVMLDDKGNEVVLYDQQKFYREATRVSETEYNFMVTSILRPVQRNG